MVLRLFFNPHSSTSHCGPKQPRIQTEVLLPPRLYRSLAHSAHSLARGKVNGYIFCVFFSTSDHSASPESSPHWVSFIIWHSLHIILVFPLSSLSLLFFLIQHLSSFGNPLVQFSPTPSSFNCHLFISVLKPHSKTPWFLNPLMSIQFPNPHSKTPWI